MSENDTTEIDRRDDALYEANETVKIGNLQFRPFSVTTLQNARKLKLTMISGSNPDELDNEELIRQTTVYAWMQCAPIREVSTAIREGNADLEAEVFGAALDIPTLKKLMAEITRHAQQIEAHAFELQPRDPDREDTSPPNS